jgi:hypothetical protein
MMGAGIGSNRGTTGMAGGAAGAALGSLLGLTPLGPAGALLGSVAGGWLGSLFGKPKHADDQANQDATASITNIPSKIDTTNKQLELVNRNLIALKEKFEPYPLQESYYFGQRMSTGIGSQGLNITLVQDSSGNYVVDAVNSNVNLSQVRVLQGA